MGAPGARLGRPTVEVADEVEAQIQLEFRAGDLQRAATTLLRAYGAEIYGFLRLRLRDRDTTGEVFAVFTEDLWSGLGGFRWSCSARAWADTLARHAACRVAQQERRQTARHVPLSSLGPSSELRASVYSETGVAMKHSARSAIARLRDQLPEEDQAVLILRIHRDLSWTDIARIMTEESESSDAELASERLAAEAARLRKRFQLAKDKMRRLAAEEGWT
jgi:RNA polymerase sigma-70 factor (ECF subfamily)